MIQNIVMIDFEPSNSWPFLTVLKEVTGQEWIEKNRVKIGSI